MLKFFKDWIGPHLNIYKVTDASDVGSGLTKQEWYGENTATQIGTTIEAQIMNDMQKGLLHSVSAVRSVGSNKDVYTVNLTGIEEFGMFAGLKLLLKVDSANQFANVTLKLGNNEYPLYRLKGNNQKYFVKGTITNGRDYLVHFDGTQFIILQDFNFGTEVGTTLEGMQMARILGVGDSDYAGLITETGTKTAGKVYFDVSTKSMYLCKNTNSQTYVDNNNFVALSNQKILDRLENLSEITILKNSQIDSKIINFFQGATLTKRGNIVVFNGYLKDDFDSSINNPGAILFRLPFNPIETTWVAPSFVIRENGDVYNGAFAGITTKKIERQQHFNFVYVAKD